ncbi:MAG: hypothetical protein QXQ94_09655 [Candidatus Bathyarchaeia archaeon]
MENIRQGKGDATDIIYLLNLLRISLKPLIPNVRDPFSRQLHAVRTSGIESCKALLSSIDEAMRNLDFSSINRELFEDFMEGRDLIKELMYNLERAAEAIKNLIETYDKLDYWTNKSHGRV